MRTLARLFACLAFAGSTLLPSVVAQAPSSERARPVAALVVLEPERVEVGQPFRATVFVRHPSALRVSLDDVAVTDPTGISDAEPSGLLVLDRSWVLFDEGGVATRPDPEAPGRAVTTKVLTLASLEPGLRELPRVAVDYTVGGVAHRFLVEAGAIDVVGVLGPEEDAPRPLTDFRDVPEPPTQPVAWLARALLAVAALAVVWLCARFVRRLRDRRRARPAAPPAPREVLARLGTELAHDDPDQVVALHYAITREARRSLDEELAAGLTDDEWLAELDPLRGAEVAEQARALFEDCARVKYGYARPTLFAVRETLERADRLCAVLAGQRAPKSRASEPALAREGAES